VLANGCRTRDDYLMARRVGRGTRLTRQKRAQILASVPMPCGLSSGQRGLWEPGDGQTGRG